MAAPYPPGDPVTQQPGMQMYPPGQGYPYPPPAEGYPPPGQVELTVKDPCSRIFKDFSIIFFKFSLI